MSKLAYEFVSLYRSLSKEDQNFIFDLLSRFRDGKITEDEIHTILSASAKW